MAKLYIWENKNLFIHILVYLRKTGVPKKNYGFAKEKVIAIAA